MLHHVSLHWVPAGGWLSWRLVGWVHARAEEHAQPCD
jgi:hypothetical protein